MRFHHNYFIMQQMISDIHFNEQPLNKLIEDYDIYPWKENQ